MPERVQRYKRRLIAQQKDERRQDKGDRRQLSRQHLIELLHSLTHEWGRRRTAQHHLNCLSDRTFHSSCLVQGESHITSCCLMVFDGRQTKSQARRARQKFFVTF